MAKVSLHQVVDFDDLEIFILYGEMTGHNVTPAIVNRLVPARGSAALAFHISRP
jgi:hypothetical protein